MADKSLADIIKQKRANRFNLPKQQPQQKKGNFNQKQNKGKSNQGKFQNKGRLFKEVQKDLGIKTIKKSVNTDARNKIIQKQRGKFVDARDKLAQIAKTGDARDKLNKIRTAKPGQKVIPQQKKNTVVQKKNVNIPRQTFKVGGQTRMKGNAVVRTVAGTNQRRKQQQQQQQVIVRNQVRSVKTGSANKGRMNNNKGGLVSKSNRNRTQPIANNQNVITIRNDSMQDQHGNTYQIVKPGLQLGPRVQSFGGGMGIPSAMDSVVSMRPTQNIILADDYEEVRPSRLRITAANSNYRVSNQQQQYMNNWQPQQQYMDDWQPQQQQYKQTTVFQQPMKRPYFNDQVDYQQVYPKKVMAVPQPQQESGTKVVVSNLHPCVSVEDMEELFGTVGSVVSVRMIRPGTAEAIFVSQDDAYRAVELFNNRQLDGQPMKVMVLRKKQNTMNHQVQSRSVLRNARGRTGGYYVQ